ncbi:hypothetical protein PMAC_000354 [Pneumocystis sp. 'macacae']|nr:hypothetical protein PMAC_000354 [Pneumocystis sp. 'macacae']
MRAVHGVAVRVRGAASEQWLRLKRGRCSDKVWSTGQQQGLMAALESAVWHATEQIAETESLELRATATSGFVASLSTLVFSQIHTLGEDVESFAKHRGGKVVNVEDVLVGGWCSRRC